ncbi:MAG: alanine--tRNA ligase, partial [Candidatus Bathyarchaeota archaeon]
KYVVIEKTAFYPEGGGQPADHGHLKSDRTQSDVVDVQKIGNVIVHVLKGLVPKEGEKVIGSIDWERRNNLMKHHTGTHIIMGATRRVLGEHVWQAGAHKDVEKARLDVSHFQRLTLEEIHEIERLANQAIVQNISVETTWMPREEAEKRYGFRLYQGGVVPGRKIRVVKSGDWEVEACGGTHLKNTGEIGFIKIVHTERIQDGVERIIFSAGLPALKAVQANEKTLWKLSESMNAPIEELKETAERLVKEWKDARREKKRLIKEIAAAQEGTEIGVKREKEEIEGVNFEWLRFKELDVDRMIQTANKITSDNPRTITVCYGADKKTARIVIMAGKDALDLGINSIEIAAEASSVLGGGGSGRPSFAQGGGTRVNKMLESKAKAKETVREQLKRRVRD